MENIDCSYSCRCQHFDLDSLLRAWWKQYNQFSFGQQILALEENVDSIHFHLCQRFHPNSVSDDCEEDHYNYKFSLEHHGKCRLQLLFPMSTLRSQIIPWNMQKTMNSVLVWTTDLCTWGDVNWIHLRWCQRFDPNSECRMIAKWYLSTTTGISA